MDTNGGAPAATPEPGALYDAFYFQHGCGEPYGRTERLLGLFETIAEKIVRSIGPGSVLDAGCAQGLLVEMLRDRGVEAFGVDISEYAIGEVREDIRPFCWAGSVLDPFPRRYDLIVCMEVAEHLPPEDAEALVTNLCRHSDDILFSSSPHDYREATHFNVRPPEYWAGLFAERGFFHDVDYDASFVIPWAARFRKSAEPVHRLIQPYERRLWHLKQESQTLRSLVLEARDQAAELQRLSEDLRLVLEHRDQVAAHRDQLAAELNRMAGSRTWRFARMLQNASYRLRSLLRYAKAANSSEDRGS